MSQLHQEISDKIISTQK